MLLITYIFVFFCMTQCAYCIYTPMINASIDESALENPLDNEEANNILGFVPLLNRKIFKGTRVVILEHPYIVSIRRQYAHYLTGTILSRYVIITIAHPLVDVPLTELSVICGENYADRGTVMYTVLLFLPNPGFDPYTLRDDVALIRVYEAITFRPAIRPIGNVVHSSKSFDSDQGFVTGWGRCDLSGNELCLPRSSRWFPNERFDPMLRSVTIPLENDACRAYAQYGLKLKPGMLCVGQAREQNPKCPCMAVPGAPLVVAGELLGLQSWGFGCGYKTDLPIIYTDVRHYYEWLEYNFKYLTLNITSENLQLLFEATKAQYLLHWLEGTRAHKLAAHHHAEQDLHPWNLDHQLALVSGTTYDIRDYVEGGSYRKLKKEMYKLIQLNLKYSQELDSSTLASRMKDEDKSTSKATTLWNGLLQTDSDDYYDSKSDDSKHRPKILPKIENDSTKNESDVLVLNKIFKGWLK